MSNRSRAFSVLYTALISALFVALVSAVALATRQRIELNEQVATQREILKVSGLWDSQRYASVREMPAAQIAQRFERLIQGPKRVGGLELYYARNDSGQLEAIIFDIQGMGFWGPIHGWLAVEPGTNRIKGISFDRQEETPGLGGEIVKPWFQQQFVGIELAAPRAGRPAIELVSNAAEKLPNQVDAITGASRTSYAVQQMLNADIAAFLAAGVDALPAE
ncbi:MAG: FMN-binding protein [Candidatus Alcyoniella australis]|nr:FMN-binding protein [Candidatus Alcyoniella australis]